MITASTTQIIAVRTVAPSGVMTVQAVVLVVEPGGAQISHTPSSQRSGQNTHGYF